MLLWLAQARMIVRSTLKWSPDSDTRLSAISTIALNSSMTAWCFDQPVEVLAEDECFNTVSSTAKPANSEVV